MAILLWCSLLLLLLLSFIMDEQSMKVHAYTNVTLTFEGIGNLVPVGSYYNGEGGGNYSIFLSRNLVAGIDSDAGGTATIANEPSPSTIITNVDVQDCYFNILDGFFVQEVSFYFSCQILSTSITYNVYTGIDGAGNIVGSGSLFNNFNQGSGDPTGLLNTWNYSSVQFAGNAKSIVFKTNGNPMALDDVSLVLSLPTMAPTKMPTKSPTRAPTKSPTLMPTREPTKTPTKSPTRAPTKFPTTMPTREPTKSPTTMPTRAPATKSPIMVPTKTTTASPTMSPITSPITAPTPSNNNNDDCGLFGLSLFCPRRGECGFWKRLFNIGGC